MPAYTFGASDLHVRLWFVVDGVNVGDKASVVWIAPNNSVYRSGSYSPASAPGRWCYGDPLALAGTAAADFAGQWTINVYWNGALLFGTNFNLQGPVSIPPAPTGAWSFSAAIQHQGQPQKWMCGPTTMAMWLGYLNNAGYDPNGLASAIGTTEEGTSLPQFVQGMFDFTRYGYVYSSWGYEDKHAAIKGIMWTIARYNEPVVVVGGNFHWGDNLDLGEPLGWATGLHYLLVRGGRADKNPFQYFSEDNHIRGVWVNDATEDSPRYHGPVSGMRKDTEYPPARLMEYWGLTGAPWYKFWDKRHTSIERDCYACWQRQGGHYTLNDSFLDY